MNILKNRTTLIAAQLMVLGIVQSCYEDKGNYDYQNLPGAISISIPETNYSKGLAQDTLFIKPEVKYSGPEEDLTYEWQYFNASNEDNNLGEFETFAVGKDLAYKVGIDEVVTGIGTYTFRLAVSNKNLIGDAENTGTNQTYSKTVNLEVGYDRNYLGLMVLHGNGSESDVGLIEDPLFVPNPSVAVEMNVNPTFYSEFNAGEKIPGVGHTISLWGNDLPEGFGSPLNNQTNILVFTDQVGYRLDQQSMIRETIDYSFMLPDPSMASNTVEAYEDRSRSTPAKAFVQDGQIFYGDMFSPLRSEEPYRAAPIIDLVYYSNNSTNVSIGVLGFDEISKAFIYSPRTTGTLLLKKFPTSFNGFGVDLSDTGANLEYLETRTLFFNTMAVMNDIESGSKFLLELGLQRTPLEYSVMGKYDMSALPIVNEIEAYAFGWGDNLNYLATNQKLYQYFYNTTNSVEELYSFPPDEQVNMMKIIKEEPEYGGPFESRLFYNSHKLMAVATKTGGGKGKLYIFEIDWVTGELLLVRTYDGTEYDGENFGVIYDVDIKLNTKTYLY
jgi:hypothetical protein